MSCTQWCLDALFTNETEADKALKEASERAQSFETLMKGNLKNIRASDFLESLRAYESILELLGRVMTYAFLRFAKDANEGGFLAKYQQATTLVHEKILFFELEFNRLPKNTQRQFIEHAKPYQYYLESLQEEKPHQLSQKEERILLKKSTTSASAFSRLFDEHFSRLQFVYEGKKLSEEKVLSLLHDPSRDVRQKAATALSKGLKPHQPLLAYIFNMIKQDHATECELREYKTPEEPRHKDNKISQKSVDALVDATQARFDLVQEYYETKRVLLGYETLYDYDRYAPLGGEDETYTYDHSCEIVLNAFERFSPRFAQIANDAFAQGWVDVYPEKGKRGGAFSHPATPNAHPYVLLNHTDKRRDVFTLAHEMGHAIHQYLSNGVGYLNGDTPLTTSETASVFAEMLVFDSIKEGLSGEKKQQLLAGKIEDIFATLYRQINFTTFERRVHAHEGELSLETFNQYWNEESAKMFGPSVTLTKQYEMWWSYIPHFIHTPFYCYAYSYGQLLVLALYGLYKRGTCKDFVSRYGEFLSAGGSKSPRELVALFGFDIDDEEFWQIGLGEVEALVREFKGGVDASRIS
ncbi:MAG: M3 family oligoendopeptidase [Campylobacterales bacterium]|nr:M3 family oligoendopeptidase [Campylobacterales bacterium]